MCRYLHPRKFVFDNGSDFKRDFTSLLKEFDIKTVLMSVKNPQDNSPVEQVHQVILKILVTKDLDNKLFDYIDPWSKTLANVSWEIRAYYHCTIMSTPSQAVSVRNMLI